MNIIYHEKSRQFHIFNDKMSYVIGVFETGEIISYYYGKKIKDRDELAFVTRTRMPAMIAGPIEHWNLALEMRGVEYPAFGASDLRSPAFELKHADGSRLSKFEYVSHTITRGKKVLPGLPSAHADEKDSIQLAITLEDKLQKVRIELFYTIFENTSAVVRSATITNIGDNVVDLDRAMSASFDLPDQNFEWMQFSGAWVRERRPIIRPVKQGTVSIESARGHSSAFQNPFVILKRPDTNEFAGEAYGVSFVYSGNFLALAEADGFGMTRVQMGINPRWFSFDLQPSESFVTPEVVLSYTSTGLNSLSNDLTYFFRNYLMTSQYKDKVRPILLNNWEATTFNFNEESIVKIASKAKEVGAELFVLDDGWFGERNDDRRGLGDWYPNLEKLPGGIKGLAEKIHAMGLKFGLWFEPEMVNPVSRLYSEHPDYALTVPGRGRTVGRSQIVLDFSKKEVVDYIYDMVSKVIEDGKLDYIKWDMNRSISECYSIGVDPKKQGRIYHNYILGVYDLYERLTKRFPNILFESCSSGGARFDAGLLYYAPQAWCSDDTDAVERVYIQYGSTYGYPVSSIGAHVSAVPNWQTGRSTSIDFRANVACFGTFGYELDLNLLPDDEIEKVKKQIEFMKENRELLQFGDFYRLIAPFNNDHAAWMVVSKDKSKAIVGYYQLHSDPCNGYRNIKLTGLDPDREYTFDGKKMYGDELMYNGIDVTELREHDAESALFFID